MWKRMSCGLALLTAAAGANAQFVTGADDGCGILADLVYSEVLAGGYEFRLPEPPEDGSVRVCDQTAQSASAGFTKAMATMNVFVRWQTPEDQRGDYCLSHDIEQCYPGRNPYAPYTAAESRLVADAWWSVLRAVRASMPPGGGDTSRFVAAELRQQVASELNRTTRGGWEAYRELR